MGVLLLLAPLAVISAPFMIIDEIFINTASTFTDIITIWTNFFA